jgi:5'-nucleotidase
MSMAQTQNPQSDAVPPRAWQRMLSGRRLDLLDPSPLDIEIEDIAHGLARIARWNGQTVGANIFSVAQHCLLVDDICCALAKDLDPRWRLAGLLHDAAEYVIGDLISPFKAAIGLNYRELEARLLAAIHIRFSLPPVLPEKIARRIKRADRMAAYFEATRLAGFGEEEAAKFFSRPSGLGPGSAKFGLLEAVSADRAQADFLARFRALQENAEPPA